MVALESLPGRPSRLPEYQNCLLDSASQARIPRQLFPWIAATRPDIRTRQLRRAESATSCRRSTLMSAPCALIAGFEFFHRETCIARRAMRDVLPVVILKDRQACGNLAKSHVCRTADPIRIWEIVQDRLSNGSGDAIVLLLWSLGHELHTLWQRAASEGRCYRSLVGTGFRHDDFKSAGRSRLIHRRNFIRAASGSLPNCSPISGQLRPSRTNLSISLTSIRPASSSCSLRALK